jgi:gluconokinase
MNNDVLIWIIIGISGSGKSTIGRLLSQWLECDFYEGDRRHSPENILKMSSSQPLQDEDRRQWLGEIEDDIRWAIDRNRETVMTCSALKKIYRQQLTFPGGVQLVWIDVPEQILRQRLEGRDNHFMPASMLNSQLAAFQAISADENIITVDGSKPIDDVMQELILKALERFPHLNKPWWQRCI